MAEEIFEPIPVLNQTVTSRILSISEGTDCIKYSDDFGITWENSILDDDETHFIYGAWSEPLRLKSGILIIHALGLGAQGILYSTDGGGSWKTCAAPADLGAYNNPTIMNTGEIIISPMDESNSSLVSRDGKTWETRSGIKGGFTFTKWQEPEYSNYVDSGEGRDLMVLLGCSSLTELGAKLRKRTWVRDFSDIKVGDWFELPTLSYKDFVNDTPQDGIIRINQDIPARNLRFVLCGMNIYDGINEKENPGFLFQSENIVFHHNLWSTSVNKDFINTSVGLIFSEGTMINDFETQLGIKDLGCNNADDINKGLRRVYRLYDGQSFVSEKIFIPTECEVTGKRNWSNTNIDQSAVQWPIFSYHPQRRAKWTNDVNYKETRDRSSEWWTATKSITNNFHTCINHGANWQFPTNEVKGVAPCIYI